MTKAERLKRRLLRHGYSLERLQQIELEIMSRELNAIEAELRRRWEHDALLEFERKQKRHEHAD